MIVHLKEWSHYHLSLAIVKIYNQDEQLKQQSQQIESHSEQLNQLKSQMANITGFIGVQSDLFDQAAAASKVSSSSVSKKVAQAVASVGDIKLPNLPEPIARNPTFKSTFLWKIPVAVKSIATVKFTAKQVIVAGGYNILIVCTKHIASHLSLLVKLISKQDGENLKWPMKASIAISVLKGADQLKNRVHFLTTKDALSSAFQKPKGLIVSAVEVPHFCQISALKSHVSNNTLSLKIEVKSIDGKSEQSAGHVIPCEHSRFLKIVPS